MVDIRHGEFRFFLYFTNVRCHAKVTKKTPDHSRDLIRRSSYMREGAYLLFNAELNFIFKKYG